MVSVTLTPIANLANSTTAVTNINNNSTAIEDGFEDCLSINDTSSNTMGVNLNMNSQHLINLPAPTSPLEPVRLTDINTLMTSGTVNLQPVPTGGTTGQVLAKNSSANYDIGWDSSGMPTGGTVGQVLAKNSSTNYDVSWATAGASVPGLTGGRLTLTSNTPVLASNATGQSTIYYTPYLHNAISIYNGTIWQAFTFTQQSVTLDTTNVLSGKLYDLFMFSNSGTANLGYGPAWTNNTTRSAAITQTVGAWTNTSSITLRQTSSTTFNISANQAVYVGTFYATANGQTGMALTGSAVGGASNVLGLYNAYNRERVFAQNFDTTAGYGYTSATWRQIGGNTGDIITYVDGLANVYVQANFIELVDTGTFLAGVFGIARDWTSGAPSHQSLLFGPELNPSQSFSVQETSATCPIDNDFPPALGVHTIYALEADYGGGSGCSFYGNSFGAPVTQIITLTARMSI